MRRSCTTRPVRRGDALLRPHRSPPQVTRAGHAPLLVHASTWINLVQHAKVEKKYPHTHKQEKQTPPMKLCPIPSDGLQSPSLKAQDLLPARGVFKKIDNKITLNLLVVVMVL